MKIIQCKSYRNSQPKAETSSKPQRPVRVVKSGASINIPVVPTPETIQTVKQLTKEWADPVLNRERPTKQQILETLGGTYAG